MEQKVGKIIKNAAILYCVVFSATTIISSLIQLSRGQTTDANSHIINRAVICLIGVLTITLMVNVRIKNRPLSYIVSYAISILTVFAYVWVTGFFGELHPNAYRDIFLNFTIVFIVVAVTITITQYLRSNKNKEDKK